MTKGIFEKLLGILSEAAIPPLSSTLPSGETQCSFTNEANADCLNETTILSLVLLSMMKILYYLVLKNLQTISYQQ